MGAAPLHTAQQLRDSYRRTTERLGEAAARCGRRPAEIVLVAVTKTAGPDQIRQLVEMGHQDFAENRVQHLAHRVAQLQEFLARRKFFGAATDPDPGLTPIVSPGLSPGRPRTSPRINSAANPRSAPHIHSRTKASSTPPEPVVPPLALPVPRWHMIGHLQRNKAKLVLPLVRLIHSVDSLRLAEELHALGGRMRSEATRSAMVSEKPSPGGGAGTAGLFGGSHLSAHEIAAEANRRSEATGETPTIDILIQVNASGEESKFGVAVPAVTHLAEQIDSMIHLRLRGLMTMAPYSDRPEDARSTFARTAELFHEIRSGRIGGPHFNILSMGMSGDFEVAIQEGANLVRVGRAIFGEGDPAARDANEALQFRRPDDEEEDGVSLPDPGPVLDFGDDDAAEDEGPKTAAARQRSRQASEKNARARVARENRSSRETNR